MAPESGVAGGPAGVALKVPSLGRMMFMSLSAQEPVAADAAEAAGVADLLEVRLPVCAKPQRL